jgi:hypothetical protein
MPSALIWISAIFEAGDEVEATETARAEVRQCVLFPQPRQRSIPGVGALREPRQPTVSIRDVSLVTVVNSTF